MKGKRSPHSLILVLTHPKRKQIHLTYTQTTTTTTTTTTTQHNNNNNNNNQHRVMKVPAQIPTTSVLFFP